MPTSLVAWPTNLYFYLKLGIVAATTLAYNFDFALIKPTAIGRRISGLERADLQFRGEFFNLFNVVSKGLPANTIRGSAFGVISKTAGASRQIQFSTKVIY